MKRICLTILIIITISYTGYSQGFDWQYSARLPFEVPSFFIGLNGSGSYGFMNGDFNICDNGIPCDTFTIGNAIGLSAGIKLEYWQSADIAYFSTIAFHYNQNSFKNENLYYYFPDAGTKTLEYEYLRTEYIPEVEIGVKFRLRFLLPHLFSALSIKAGYVANTSEELVLRKISEADWLADEIHFTGFEPLGLSKFVYSVNLKVGYDVNLGLGKFASIYLDLGLPLQNRYSFGTWEKTSLLAGVSIFPFGF